MICVIVKLLVIVCALHTTTLLNVPPGLQNKKNVSHIDMLELNALIDLLQVRECKDIKRGCAKNLQVLQDCRQFIQFTSQIVFPLPPPITRLPVTHYPWLILPFTLVSVIEYIFDRKHLFFLRLTHLQFVPKKKLYNGYYLGVYSSLSDKNKQMANVWKFQSVPESYMRTSRILKE